MRMAQRTDIKLDEVRENGKRAFNELKAEDATYSLSLAGEGALLGGAIVIDRTGKVHFAYMERVFGDVADPVDLLAALKVAATTPPRHQHSSLFVYSCRQSLAPCICSRRRRCYCYPAAISDC
eukprot:m.184278 g.184278  ORF g.184278 m.184278 type:complete len:123 (-) comp32182_c0_seq5:68-436(-)